jgi:hypothetical protein
MSYPKESSMNQPTVLLAKVGDRHIQVGPVREWADAYDVFEALDFDQNGFYRDKQGRMRGTGQNRKMHAIKGEPVKFYRLRQVGHEFGDVERVRSTGVRRTGFVGLKSSRK